MAEKINEHPEHYDIASLNVMARERGHIPWDRVIAWCNQFHESDLSRIRELTTGDSREAIQSDNPDIQAWLYYLYCLAANSPRFFEYYFREIYRDYFEPQGAKEDIDITPAQPQAVFTSLIAYRNPATRPADKTAALNQFIMALLTIRHVANHFRIDLTGSLSQMDDYLRNQYLLSEIDLGDFHTALTNFYGEYTRQKKGMTKKILKRPLPANMPVFLGIRAEHAALGKSGKYLDSEAAKDFARFLIGVSFRDVNPGNTMTEWTRKGFRAVIAEFPFLKELSEDAEIEEHEIEHLFEKVSPELIAALIGYLRMQITAERAKGPSQGIKSGDIPKVKTVLHYLDELLASSMAKFIIEGTEGNPAKMAEKASEVVYALLRKPLAHVQHDVKGAVAHLKGIPVPKHEEGGKHVKLKKGWEILAQAASIFSAIEHVFDRAGLIRRGDKKEKGSESKKEASAGHP